MEESPSLFAPQFPKLSLQDPNVLFGQSLKSRFHGSIETHVGGFHRNYAGGNHLGPNDSFYSYVHGSENELELVETDSGVTGQEKG